MLWNVYYGSNTRGPILRIPWSGIRHWNPYFLAHNDVGICQRLPLPRLYTLDSVTQTSLPFFPQTLPRVVRVFFFFFLIKNFNNKFI
jgi:hypothetical protein